MKIRGFAGIRAFACLLVTLLGAAVSAFAQTHVANLAATNPTFLAIDSRGGTTWLYVSEHGDVNVPPSGGGRILRYNLTTGSTTPQVVANRGSGDGQFTSPDGIVVEPATGDLFISDRYLNRIQRLSVNATTGAGTFVMKWGTGTASAADEMHGPVGLAIDSAGAIYVAEHGDMGTQNGGGFVSKYTLSGTTATRAWRNSNGFNTPYGIAVSGSTLLISDGFNQQVQVWNLSGSPTGQFSTTGDIPLGLSIDAAGGLWIAESSNNGNGSIQIVEKRTIAGAPAGVSFGSLGSGDSQFSLPFHAVLNSATNRLYVADYGNNRVQVFDMATTPPPTAPTIANQTVSGVAGTAVNYQVVATGATSFSIASGTLPAGLAMSTSGLVTGTPSAAGNTTVTVRATNANGSTNATLTFNIAASGGGGGGGTIVQGPAITSMVLAGGNSSSGTFTVTFNEAVTGVGPEDFVIYGAGGTTGTVTGVTGSGASYTVAFDYFGATGSLQLAIRTSGTGITSAANSAAYAGVGVTASAPVPNNNSAVTAPPTATITAGTAGSSSVSFTVAFNKAVSTVQAADFKVLQTSGAGASVGTVSPSGNTYTVAVNFTGTGSVQLLLPGGATTDNVDASGNVMAQSAISTSVNVAGTGGGGSAPTIANQTVSGVTGTAVNYQVVASGATSFSIASGTLPAGLAMSTAGVITGTPSAAGNTTVTVRATNANGSTDASLTFNITASGGGGSAPTIANQTVNGTAGTAVNYQVVATGATSFSVISGTLPAGLTMSTAGVITGTPSAAGNTTVTVRATNANGATDASLTFNIAASGGGGSAPSITSATTASGKVGTAFSYSITASGSPTSYAATNLSGTGLSVNTSTGVISGTPTAAGTISSTISATNSFGTGTRALTITVANSAAPVVSSAGTASAMVGATFSYAITASGSPTSFNATGLAGTGLSVNTSTGVISGIPSAAGTINSTISATNSGGSGTKALAITVAPAPSNVPVIGNQATTGVVGEALSYQVAATGATSFSVVTPPALPAGLTMSASGLISGTPTTAANTVLNVRATNANGSADATVTIAIRLPAPPPPPPPPAKTSQTVTFNSPVSAIRVGVPVQLGATASSGLPITYSVVSGSATINGTTLTPTGTSTLIVRAAQAGNATYAAASSDVNFGAPGKGVQTITFSAPKPALITDGTVQLTATSSSGLPITFSLVSGPAILNGSTLTLTGDPGVIVVKASQAGDANVGAATDVSVLIPVWMAPGLKVMGLGSEVGADIVHPNGNVYDQILMTGDYATITADPRQITRVSFVDLTDDIVQVEFSGAGSLTITLDDPSGPAVATKYNQSNVKYMKGHANISVTGADETTNLSVFSVGTTTAVNQSLFPAGVTYDAMADIGLISISSTNGKFGGLRTANASYMGTKGMIGVSAPGVTFTGPVYIGDINAADTATGMIVVGSAPTLSITGGDLSQLNSHPIQVNGITNLTFTAGTKSNGVTQPALTNQAQFEKNGADVTTQIIH